MNDSNDDSAGLEAIWDQLLSRDAALIRRAYAALSIDEQRAVLAHLQRMAAEPGWHDEQRISAQVALAAISYTGSSHL